MNNILVCFLFLWAEVSLADNLFPQNGGVGIGTTAPAAKLQISNPGGGIYDSLLGYGANSDLYLRAGQFGKIVIGDQNIGAVEFTGPGNKVMNGKLGVGTLYPTFKFEIMDTVSANRRMGIGGFQTMYFPGVAFENSSFFLGDGGQYLQHTKDLEGYYNMGVGMRSLQRVTTGSYNTSLGFEAMNYTETGSWNTALGEAALIYNIDGHGNTASGWKALLNMKADYNTATGYAALLQATYGVHNTAMGTNSMFSNTTGVYNTATGSASLYSKKTGDYNTILGAHAFYDLKEGNNNTVIGFNSGKGIVTGSSNTIIGANISGLSPGLSNNIIISDGNGNRRINVDASGNLGVAQINPSYKLDVNGTIRGYGITDSSDIRLKQDIHPLGEELSKILKLEGVSYFWIDRTKENSRQIGFIAQDLEKIYPELVSTDKEGLKSINYSHLISPMVNALKDFHSNWLKDSEKLRREIEALKGEARVASDKNEMQKQKIDDLNQEVSDLKIRFTNLEKTLSAN